MALPTLIDKVTIKDWTPVSKKSLCYLYNMKSMGISLDQFKEIIVGRKAMLFEKPFEENLRGQNCPWCDFKARKGLPYDNSKNLNYHVFTHSNKNPVSYQLVKFQKEIYTLRLQLVRRGWDECIPMFVEHSCQDCISPKAKDRRGMCVFPVSPRSRMRSLRMLGYPVKHLTKHKKRSHQWSALAVIILIKN